jgi:hypothetical protein
MEILFIACFVPAFALSLKGTLGVAIRPMFHAKEVNNGYHA